MSEGFIRILVSIHLIDVYSNFLEIGILLVRVSESFIYLITLIIKKEKKFSI